ncbi:MAG: hypothetical protein AAF799_35155 [Myxococcota bacterium]
MELASRSDGAAVLRSHIEIDHRQAEVRTSFGGLPHGVGAFATHTISVRHAGVLGTDFHPLVEEKVQPHRARLRVSIVVMTS